MAIRSGKLMKVVCTVVVTWMVVVPHAEAAISCGTVVSNLTPCIYYLQNGGAVRKPCCDGVKTLNRQAKTTPDRQAACKCVKSLATSIPSFSYDFASSLAGKCGVNLPYKITPTLDCSIVH